MKILLIVLLIVLKINANAQSVWPRDARTGKVEFKSEIPWPIKNLSDTERQILVRKWFLAKLSDIPKADLKDWVTDPRIPLTYASLPSKSFIEDIKGEKRYRLSYKVNLIPNAKNLCIQLTNFEYGFSEEDSGWVDTLESELGNSIPNNNELSIFLVRINESLKGFK